MKGIQGDMRGGGLLSLGRSTKGSVSMQWELGKEDTASLTHSGLQCALGSLLTEPTNLTPFKDP